MLTAATITAEFELLNQGWITTLVGAARTPATGSTIQIISSDTSSSGSQLLFVSRDIPFVIKLHLQLNAIAPSPVASRINDSSRAPAVHINADPRAYEAAN